MSNVELAQSLPMFYRAYLQISNFISSSLSIFKTSQIVSLIKILEDAYANDRKILVMGAGRSGLVGRAFAMRLKHLGFDVYVLGDTIVSPIRRGDVVVAISGSGRTALIVTAAEAAKTAGAVIVAITTYIDSPLAKIADIVVEVPGRAKVSRIEDYFARQVLGVHEPLAPLGTLFEDCTMIFLDSIIAELMHKLGKTEEDLRQGHANIEV
ncbi:MAG: 6-phospho-3-hexuloisomerase [Ignisphaera sp.]|nr:6-phospho-3-hexuloisomerase [Ignisphaera sp.]MCX8168326.1 6-phospho-3-hexuloisomerase [Ignisphaera sp.]MDW8085342.1 6-phospho-3-hexuloisomerase [Ignisphaera sp.]